MMHFQEKMDSAGRNLFNSFTGTGRVLAVSILTSGTVDLLVIFHGVWICLLHSYMLICYGVSRDPHLL